MKKPFKIAAFLIIVLILINIAAFYYLNPESPTNEENNTSVIEQEETLKPEEIIIPDCDDYDKCTTEWYNSNLQTCIYEEVPNCRDIIKIGDLSAKDGYSDYYEIDDDEVYVNSTLLEEEDITGIFEETGTKVNVVLLDYSFYFEQDIENMDRDNLEFAFECEDSKGVKARSKGDFGGGIAYKDDDIYFGLDEAYIECSSAKCYGFADIKDMSKIGKGYENGEAKIVISLMINQEYKDLELECNGEFTTETPKQDFDFDFDIIYES